MKLPKRQAIIKILEIIARLIVTAIDFLDDGKKNGSYDPNELVDLSFLFCDDNDKRQNDVQNV